MRGHYGLMAALTALTLALDQVSKWLFMRLLPEHTSIQVIDGLFDLVNIRNRGAAFGFLNRADIEWQFWFFLGATVVAVAAIFKLASSAKDNALLLAGLGLIRGGALGNLVDRVRFRSVVDFLDVYYGQWHWPAFNVADSAIFVGAVLTCLTLWRTPSATEDGTNGGGKE